MEIIILIEEAITNAILTGITGLVLLFFLIVAILYFGSIYKRKKYEETIEDKSNSVRVIIIDKEKEIVKFFNRSNIRKVRTISLDQFYVQFPDEEIENLAKWLDDLLMGEDVNDYYEINVFTNKKKKIYYSLLQVQEINKKEKKLYLESYLFKSNISINKNDQKIFSTSEEINKAIMLSSPFKGITFYFKFPVFQKNSTSEDNDRFVFTQIKNLICQYVSPTRLALELSKNEIALFDLKMNNRPSGIFLVHQIIKDVNKFLGLHGVLATTKFGIGIIENRFFPKDMTKLLKESKHLSHICIEDNITYLWYEKTIKQASISEESYRSEVERIIRDDKLKFTFRPIIEVEKQKTIGYLSFIKPFDTFVDSYEELKEYALKTEDDKQLLSTVIRNIVPRFVNENNDKTAKLFLKSTLQERSTLLRIVNHLQHASNAHIVVLFEEYDVHYFSSRKTGEMKEVFNNFRAKGFEIGLILNDKDLVLQNSVYECFDYFLINFDLTPETKNDASTSFRIRLLVEKLLKYKKPIIASSVEGWNIIELLTNSNFKYISSETLAPQDEMFLPLPSKNMNKLKSLFKD